MSRLRNILTFLWLLGTGIAFAGVYEDMLQAIDLDDERTVTSLLKRGVDVDTVGPNGDSLLMLAAKQGSSKLVKALLEARPRINARNAYEETAVMLATFHGHTEVVRHLLAQGAEVNNTGWTPLIYAATRNRMDIARILIGHGAQVNAQAGNGTTALMMAAREGHLPMVLLLMEHGADINHKSPAGHSALGMAQDQERKEVIQILVRAGATDQLTPLFQSFCDTP